MNKFIERHFALFLVVTLPIAAALGWFLAIGLWAVLMVPLLGAID